MIFRSIRGTRIPALGFGTFGLTGPEGEAAIEYALEVGYRHLDAAIRYGNEVEVGRAIRTSGIAREDIFLTGKIWFTDLADGTLQRHAQESLDRLATDHVDLLLIHWPNEAIDLAETLRALGAVKAAGRARHIGVANFPTALMRRCVEELGAELFTNQVEYHPFLDQDTVLGLCRRYGMLLTAYIPLARGAVAHDPVLAEIGAAHGKTAAQVALRWLLQQPDVAAIPRSGRRERIRENFDVFDFALSGEEMRRIDALRGDRRIVNVDWAPQWDPPRPRA